ncbi:MAG TPA: UDP-N-acetylmuramoyl-L-alanyl-D-glutamate--2,6-diaminopimelate ligase [Solirubrobacteraceae bacterium]|jgi:UDP-N-acetylmuramoyl-L-alanyl-D-glutamate--2,6-diaminopimelate ligase|nr:UDP-N-acetylmuramoyl-L-alanyl-D-glutamate--2,6-diaminopimelate ligase [Solirubrobacteraceae bacterium]
MPVAGQRATTLHELLDALDAAVALPRGTAEELRITSLAYDSHAVEPGALFFCVPGFRSDGHDHAPAAVAAGAAALVVERELGLGVPEVRVASVRAALAPVAARFYGEPARELDVVGITGTNGKTTTSYLTRALLEAAGRQCGLLGTVKSVIGGREQAVARTTPEAIDLQADLRAMLDGGDRACAIEVSSHALELGRADAIPFAAAVFTNLTQDHLDFHATMEDYFAAKRLLFLGSPEPPRVSVVNLDDPYGRRLAGEIGGAITYALLDGSADYRASDVRVTFAGCEFTLSAPGVPDRRMRLPMPGRFNVANALAALAAATALGGDPDVLASALERGVRVPGRFEPVQADGQDFAVLVDYAHTPDSLENVLAAARELVAEAGGGRVICVFGAGGDRDRGKRPLMGEIAARLSDEVVVTSDNPRSEDPDAIIAEILRGVAAQERSSVRACSDRRAAIGSAIELARAGDIVVIAGKGHEQGQELAGGEKIPFDDVAVARELLGARGAA